MVIGCEGMFQVGCWKIVKIALAPANFCTKVMKVLFLKTGEK